jgi:hypothetical protein
MKLKRLFFGLGLSLLATAAHAQQWSFFNNNTSTGTAYRIVTDTAVNVVTASTVISGVISDSQPGVVRVNCDFDSIIRISRDVTPTVGVSGTRVSGGVPEYFAYAPRNNVGLAARSVAGSCSLSKMGQ